MDFDSGIFILKIDLSDARFEGSAASFCCRFVPGSARMSVKYTLGVSFFFSLSLCLVVLRARAARRFFFFSFRRAARQKEGGGRPRTGSSDGFGGGGRGVDLRGRVIVLCVYVMSVYFGAHIKRWSSLAALV